METRLQIYEYLLLPEYFRDATGQASDKTGYPNDSAQVSNEPEVEPSDANDEDRDRLTYDALQKELLTRKTLSNPQQPARENTKTFIQLLLVCKTIHYEATPLFFNRATFFIRNPFQFANTFLRKLAPDKIYSLRHLELRMAISYFTYTHYLRPNLKTKILSDIIKTFKTYRELSFLDSVTLTLDVTGLDVTDTISPTNRESSLIFRPVEEDSSYYWWVRESGDCMCEAVRTIAKIMRLAQFELSRDMEEVYERVPDSKYVTFRGTVARVKLERKE
jgi:hypothetical protein